MAKDGCGTSLRLLTSLAIPLGGIRLSPSVRDVKVSSKVGKIGSDMSTFCNEASEARRSVSPIPVLLSRSHRKSRKASRASDLLSSWILAKRLTILVGLS